MIKKSKVKYQGVKPYQATEFAAGSDLYANETVVIQPGEVKMIGTGTKVAIPQGYFGLIAPRSSMGKSGLLLSNSLGILDSDYIGEMKFIYYNYTDKPITVEKGQRIGQLIIIPYITPIWVEDELPQTERGEGGFGSTGKF